MINLCKKCFEENCVGSFYFDSTNPEQHLTGYIAAYCKDELVIKHISPSGFYDGFVLLHMSELIRVDIFGQYERKIAKLYSIRKQSHPVVDLKDVSFCFSILDFACQHNLVISAELEGSVVSGFVLDFNENSIHLQVVMNMGN